MARRQKQSAVQQAVPMAIGMVVLACALAASMGFRGRVTHVGVDLGTTYSVVAVRDEKEFGGVRVISDARTGSPLLPSIVAYEPGGVRTVGYGAKARIDTDPVNTLFHAKRFMGRRFDEPEVLQAASEHSFRVRKEPLPLGPVGTGGERSITSGVQFELESQGHPLHVSPEDVGSAVVRELLRMASEALGHTEFHSAVIAVPAKFGWQQRAATTEAFRRAGLRVQRILEEPTAAALAYGLNRKPHVHYILVFDFGGGTLDVSVLHVTKGSVAVLGSEGDEFLGGADFDVCVKDYLRAGYEVKEHLVPASDAEACAAQYRKRGNDTAPPAICSDSGLLILAEELKVAVNADASTPVEERHTVRCLGKFDLPEEQEPGGLCAGLGWVELSLSRSDFEEACSTLLNRSLRPVSEVLDGIGLGPSDIDEVVLVGGSSRIPAIRSTVAKFFGVEVGDLNTEIDPDRVVAIGCARVID